MIGKKKKKNKPVSSNDFDYGYGGSDDGGYVDSGYGSGYDDSGYGSDYVDSGYGDDGYSDGNGDSPKKKKKGGQRMKKGAKTNFSKNILEIGAVLLVIAVICVVVSFVVVPGKGACDKTILAAQEAINADDVDAFCELIDENSSRSISALASTSGLTNAVISKYNLETLLSESVDEVIDEYAGGEGKSLTFIPENYGGPGFSRKVTCAVIYEGQEKGYIVISLKKSIGKVYIIDMACAE